MQMPDHERSVKHHNTEQGLSGAVDVTDFLCFTIAQGLMCIIMQHRTAELHQHQHEDVGLACLLCKKADSMQRFEIRPS